jgi:hypothetical protein
VEHIIPISAGGTGDAENLAFACGGCNWAKYSKVGEVDPETGEICRLYNPRQDGWSEHFRWNRDATVILGITPVGRATVSCLKLNRDELLNQREGLTALGMHPPHFLVEARD